MEKKYFFLEIIKKNSIIKLINFKNIKIEID
jgi:hypothetical protein